jgi:hypothetical protein
MGVGAGGGGWEGKYLCNLKTKSKMFKKLCKVPMPLPSQFIKII